MNADLQLKKDASAELQWDPPIDASQAGVVVRDGVATLTGRRDACARKHAVERAAQRAVQRAGQRAGQRAVQRVRGARGVALKPVTTPKDSADRIREALCRHAQEECGPIEVIVKEGSVILRGKVGSWPERAAASTAAGSAPGFGNVVNGLTVQW